MLLKIIIRRSVDLCLATILIMIFAHPTDAAQQTPFKSTTRSVYANYIGQSGTCLDLFLSFTAFDNPDRKSSDQPGIQLFVSVFDTCNGTFFGGCNGFCVLGRG